MAPPFTSRFRRARSMRVAAESLVESRRDQLSAAVQSLRIDARQRSRHQAPAPTRCTRTPAGISCSTSCAPARRLVHVVTIPEGYLARADRATAHVEALAARRFSRGGDHAIRRCSIGSTSRRRPSKGISFPTRTRSRTARRRAPRSMSWCALRADLEARMDGAARHDPSLAQRRDGARVDRREGSAGCRRSGR